MSYDLAQSWWGGQVIVVEALLEKDQRRPFEIPLEFVRNGGDDTIAFVEHLIGQLFVEEGRLLNEDGSEADRAQPPASSPPAKYLYTSSTVEQSMLSPARGPEGKSIIPKPADTTSESTYSDSKGTTSRSGQSKFRSSLLARDGRCLLTKAERSRCTSAHLVPLTRHDLYKTILGLQLESQLYAASMGFLIRDDLHRAYDRYEWSWYCKDGKYFPHFFALEDPDMRQVHGRMIDPTVEMRVQPREYIDPRLASWHYRQCVLARIRGTAEGFKQH